jgi:hypothetical protein
MERISNENIINIKNSFLHKIQSDMEYRQSKPSVRIFRKPFAIAAAIIILCVVITGTALAMANSWGIIDLLRSGRDNLEVLPDAAAIVQHDVPQVIVKESPSKVASSGSDEATGIIESSDLVTFSVREVIYDGKFVYITVETTPLNPNYLLVAQYNEPSDVVMNLGSQFTDMEGTIADYATLDGKAMIRTYVGIRGANLSISDILEPDGTQVHIITGSIETDADTLELEIPCGADKWLEADGSYTIDTSKTQKHMIIVTLQNSGVTETAISAVPVVYEDWGIRVDKVTLESSAMSIYAAIEYTVIDKDQSATINDVLSFEFLDGNGKPIPTGAGFGSGIVSLDNTGTKFMAKYSLRAAESLPSYITLCAFNCWDKTQFETHVIEMD